MYGVCTIGSISEIGVVGSEEVTVMHGVVGMEAIGAGVRGGVGVRGVGVGVVRGGLGVCEESDERDEDEREGARRGDGDWQLFAKLGNRLSKRKTVNSSIGFGEENSRMNSISSLFLLCSMRKRKYWRGKCDCVLGNGVARESVRGRGWIL